MKNKLYQFAALVFFTTLLLASCTKENISTPESDFNQEISKRSGESGPTIQITAASSESSSPSGKSSALFCCDVEWVGFQNGPGTQASFRWNFNKYTVPSANAYRHNFTIFRNDILFYSGTFPTTGDSDCPAYNLQLIFPNGLGTCCGVYSATMADEYRVEYYMVHMRC